MLLTLGRILFWRAHPNELPASYAWLAAVLVAHVAANLLNLFDLLPWREALDAALLDTALFVIVTGLFLAWRPGHVTLPQALIALGGAGVYLGLGVYAATLALSPWVSVEVTSIPFLVWHLAVCAHVLRHSLSFPLGGAAALSLMYVVCSLIVGGMYIQVPVES